MAASPLLRVARRALLRDRWRAVLIVVLIALPVMGITTASLLLETALPTPSERATRQMGSADLLLRPLGLARRDQIENLLPTGSTIEPMWSEGDDVTADGVRTQVLMRSIDARGIASGMVTLLAGAYPAADDEVSISDALARRAGLAIGDVLATEAAGPLRVVGIVEDPRDLTRAVAIRPVQLAERPDLVPDWLVGLPEGSDVEAVARQLRAAAEPSANDEPGPQTFDEVLTRAEAGQASDLFITFVVVLGSLALVESALVAAAAFAVGIRRRQRDLGLLGAAGATPRQLGMSVLGEGLVAGLTAVIAGIGVGLGIAWLISLRLDDLVGQRTGSLELDPVVLAVAAFVGIVAAVIAAAIPAWGAARMPTLVALSGRRPPSTPARRLLVVGIVLIGIALVCAMVGPLTARAGEGLVSSLLVLVVGAVCGVLGFGACSPWLLERLERPAAHLPLAPRVALRDTARARTRNGPIVTAVLASMAAAIALATILASQQAQNDAWFRPQMASDSLVIQGSTAAGGKVAQTLGAIGSGEQCWLWGTDGSDVQLVIPMRDADGVLADRYLSIMVGDASLLTAYHAESAVSALDAGDVVMLQSAWEDLQGVSGRMVHTLGDGTTMELGAVRVTRVPFRDDGGRPDEYHASFAMISPAVAAALGVTIPNDQGQYLVRLDHDVTAADVDRAGAAAVAVDPLAEVSSPLLPPDPMMGFRMLVLGAAMLAALTVTAIAVALGEAESRSDQRTLLALGAPRGLRRRITASRGVVIAALAGLLAVPAGLLPAWGVLAPRDWPLVVPIPEVLGALLLLPLGAMVGGLLLGRPLPEWAARRDGTG